jgi:hypothetical protein
MGDESNALSIRWSLVEATCSGDTVDRPLNPHADLKLAKRDRNKPVAIRAVDERDGG